MIRIATSIIGALLLAAGVCIVIVFGNIPDVLGGLESASFGGYDLAGGIMAIAGLLMVAVIAASKSSAILNVILSQTLYSLLFFGSLVMVYLIAENRTFKWDATSRRFFTLSPQATQYLNSLKVPVEITVFHVPGEGMNKRNILNVLDRYRHASPRIEISIRNPITQPFQAMQFANDVKPGDIFIRRMDTATTSAAHIQRIKNMDEETLINAIVRAVQGYETWIYFLAGHSEKTPSEESDKKRGEDRISQLQSFLRERGYKIETLNLLASRGAMPDSRKSIIVCMGPQSDLQPPERQMLEAWLNNGGKALFMFDPITESRSGEFVEFKRLLENYGVELRHSIVYDVFAQAKFKDYLSLPVVIARYGSHSISENMPRITTLMSKARPIHKARYLSPTMIVVEFLFSTPKQTYEIDLPQAIAMGGIGAGLYKDMTPSEAPLAAASEVRLKGQSDADATKVVVYGDSDLFTDRIWDVVPSTLLANTLNWLSASENQIAIPSKRSAMAPLYISSTEIHVLRIILILLIPFTIFFGGIGYTALRKRLG